MCPNDMKLRLLLPHEPLSLCAKCWMMTTRWRSLNLSFYISTSVARINTKLSKIIANDLLNIADAGVTDSPLGGGLVAV